MTSSPYIPFYTSDFLGGTSGMTAATKGVYITILCLIYETEGPIPQSWETLARRCGCTLPAFKRAVEALVDDGKIEVTGEGLWSEKCSKHLGQRRERQSSARSAAKTRWEKNERKQRRADANAYDPQCQPEPEPEPYKKTFSSSPYDSPPEAADPSPPKDAALPREGPVNGSSTPSHREAVLAAMRLGPDGITGPGGGMIGGPADMARCARWAAEGVPEATQVQVIAAAMQKRPQGWAPRSFSYFDGIMADYVAAKDRPLPASTGFGPSKADEQERRLARWQKIARAG